MEEFLEYESGKIVELHDSEGDSSDDKMLEDCTEGEDEGFLHFKKSFLEHRRLEFFIFFSLVHLTKQLFLVHSVFEKQLLDSVENRPNQAV